MSRGARCRLLPLFLLAWLAGPETPLAQTRSFEPAQEQEESYVRDELARTIAKDPTTRTAAERALNALNQPATSAAGRQARNRRTIGARRIVNGIPSMGHPAVAAVLKSNGSAAAGAWCTGTLIGCNKVLTAAHCVAQDPSPARYKIFFQELGFFAVQAIDWPREQYKFPNFDLAVLTLATPVEGIAPMPLNWKAKPLHNSIATIVGYGRTGGSRQDYGIKREGTVRTRACTGAYAKLPLLCWNYDADVIARDSAQNTCNGDSGGGVFMRDDDDGRVVEKLFGVVSGGRDADCMRNDLSFNVDVSRFRSWIEKAGDGRLSSAMCGAPLYGGKQQEPQRARIEVAPTDAEAKLSLAVPAGAAELRVAMNAEDNGIGTNAFSLELSDGEHGYRSPDACQGSGQFSFCTVRQPRAGQWSITVKRAQGAGQVQITALVRR